MVDVEVTEAGERVRVRGPELADPAVVLGRDGLRARVVGGDSGDEQCGVVLVSGREVDLDALGIGLVQLSDPAPGLLDPRLGAGSVTGNQVCLVAFLLLGVEAVEEVLGVHGCTSCAFFDRAPHRGGETSQAVALGKEGDLVRSQH